jgi:hypothetical protein
MGLADILGGIMGGQADNHTDPYKVDQNAYNMNTAGVGSAQGQAANFNSGTQGAQVNPGQWAGIQNQLASQLQTQANGGGPNPAKTMMDAGNQQAINAQLALAAGARGVSPAMANRNAALNIGNMQQAVNQNAATQAQQQQLNAQQGLAGLAGQMGGQALSQAQLNQNAALANQAGANQYGLAQFGAGQNLQALNSSNVNAANSLNEQNAEFNAKQNSNALGQVAGLAGEAALAFSDKNLKEDIHPGDIDAEKMLQGLSTYSYKMRPGIGQPGEKVGILAQDLLKTGPGSKMVEQTPIGLALSPSESLSPMLGLIVHLNRKIEDMKAGKK